MRHASGVHFPGSHGTPWLSLTHEAVAQTSGGLTGAFLRAGSKKQQVVARPRRALPSLAAARPLSDRHSERSPGFRRRLFATASVRSESAEIHRERFSLALAKRESHERHPRLRPVLPWSRCRYLVGHLVRSRGLRERVLQCPQRRPAVSIEREALRAGGASLFGGWCGTNRCGSLAGRAPRWAPCRRAAASG
jgi:hypothetical protein